MWQDAETRFSLLYNLVVTLGLCGVEIPFGDVSRFHSLQAGVSDAISDTVDAPEIIRICYKMHRGREKVWVQDLTPFWQIEPADEQMQIAQETRCSSTAVKRAPALSVCLSVEPHPSCWRRNEDPDLFPVELSRKSASDCSWTWPPFLLLIIS